MGRRRQRLGALVLTTALRLGALVLTTALTTESPVAFDLALELAWATSCDLVRRRVDLALELALELAWASPGRRRDGRGAHHGASASAVRLPRNLRSISCDLVRSREPHLLQRTLPHGARYGAQDEAHLFRDLRRGRERTGAACCRRRSSAYAASSSSSSTFSAAAAAAAAAAAPAAAAAAAAQRFKRHRPIS
jgi:hypothetical protein